MFNKFHKETTASSPCEVEAANLTHTKAYPTSFSDHATLEFIVRETDNYSINLYDTQGMLVKHVEAGHCQSRRTDYRGVKWTRTERQHVLRQTGEWQNLTHVQVDTEALINIEFNS